eukprot:Gb_32872 [translate_table: standard]
MELAKEALKENDQLLADKPRSRSSEKFSRNGQDLIWANYRPHYVKVRKFCTLELFTPKRLKALRLVQENAPAAMVESIFKDCGSQEGVGKTVMVKKYMLVIAFNNITRIAFENRFVNNQGKVDPQGIKAGGFPEDVQGKQPNSKDNIDTKGKAKQRKIAAAEECRSIAEHGVHAGRRSKCREKMLQRVTLK